MCNYDAVCPDCVEPLVSDTKALGKIKKWLKCPVCGLRFREVELELDNRRQIEALKASIEESNLTPAMREAMSSDIIEN